MASLMERALLAASDRAGVSGPGGLGMLSGFDLDRRELVDTADDHAETALAFVAEGRGVRDVLAGVFMAGFLTAMHYERLRNEPRCVQCGGQASALSGRIINPDGSEVHACGAECASEYLLSRRDAA